MENKEYITLEDYITSSGKYPERAKSKELTEEVLSSAKTFIKKVNKLLNFLEIEGKIKISSGFRPSDVNSKTPNAAKKSLHMTGHAVDLEDDSKQTLANKINSLENSAKEKFLKDYDLWLEHPTATKGKYTNWCHLDDSTSRKDRKVRVFHP